MVGAVFGFMKARKPRAYFISDLDGRHAAVLAVSSIRQVLEVVPEVAVRRVSILTAPGAAPALAMRKPGQLYVRPLLASYERWRQSHPRHPAYAPA